MYFPIVAATPMETIISSLTAAFSAMTDDALAGIGAVLPTVVPVLTAIITIGIIIKVVKKFTGR